MPKCVVKVPHREISFSDMAIFERVSIALSTCNEGEVITRLDDVQLPIPYRYGVVSRPRTHIEYGLTRLPYACLYAYLYTTVQLRLLSRPHEVVLLSGGTYDASQIITTPKHYS